MIVARSPLRVSFLGGGTDFPAYYKEHGGAVLSTTIDQYVYVSIAKKFDGRVSVRYSRTENVAEAREIKHGIIRECAKWVRLTRGFEIVTSATLPMRGSGLGSSSSLTVACLYAMSAYRNGTACPPNIDETIRYQIASNACEIEIEKLKCPIGKQDQFAAAMGGMNLFDFRTDGLVAIKKIPDTVAEEVESHTLLLYLGTVGRNTDILSRQNKRTTDNIRYLGAMQTLAHAGYDMMCCPMHFEIECFCELVMESWHLKKKLADGITNARIERACRIALKHGALAVKVNGAGGRGFLTVLAPPHRQDAIIKAVGLRRVPVKFTQEGVQIVLSD